MTIVQTTLPCALPTEREMQHGWYCANARKYEMVVPNVNIGGPNGEFDIFALRKSGFVDEVEIKLTRSDFLADFKKTVYAKEDKKPAFPGGLNWEVVSYQKHTALEKGITTCNYFSFFMPIELAKRCEVPEYAGLYVFDPECWCGVRRVKTAPRLHSRKLSMEVKYATAKKMTWRYWDRELRV